MKKNEKISFSQNFQPVSVLDHVDTRLTPEEPETDNFDHRNEPEEPTHEHTVCITNTLNTDELIRTTTGDTNPYTESETINPPEDIPFVLTNSPEMINMPLTRTYESSSNYSHRTTIDNLRHQAEELLHSHEIDLSRTPTYEDMMNKQNLLTSFQSQKAMLNPQLEHIQFQLEHLKLDNESKALEIEKLREIIEFMKMSASISSNLKGREINSPRSIENISFDTDPILSSKPENLKPKDFSLEKPTKSNILRVESNKFKIKPSPRNQTSPAGTFSSSPQHHSSGTVNKHNFQNIQIDDFGDIIQPVEISHLEKTTGVLERDSSQNASTPSPKNLPSKFDFMKNKDEISGTISVAHRPISPPKIPPKKVKNSPIYSSPRKLSQNSSENNSLENSFELAPASPRDIFKEIQKPKIAPKPAKIKRLPNISVDGHKNIHSGIVYQKVKAKKTRSANDLNELPNTYEDHINNNDEFLLKAISNLKATHPNTPSAKRTINLSNSQTHNSTNFSSPAKTPLKHNDNKKLTIEPIKINYEVPAMMQKKLPPANKKSKHTVLVQKSPEIMELKSPERGVFELPKLKSHKRTPILPAKADKTPRDLLMEEIRSSKSSKSQESTKENQKLQVSESKSSHNQSSQEIESQNQEQNFTQNRQKFEIQTNNHDLSNVQTVHQIWKNNKSYRHVSPVRTKSNASNSKSGDSQKHSSRQHNKQPPQTQKILIDSKLGNGYNFKVDEERLEDEYYKEKEMEDEELHGNPFKLH